MLSNVLDKPQIRAAKKRLLDALAKHDIFDIITVRLKETTNDHWIAQYRALSQFGRGPIFWVSPQHPADSEELAVTMGHEYGHVIAEWARIRLKDLHDERVTAYEDEEDFAEDFGQWLIRGKPNRWMDAFVRKFVLRLE